ncbi:hypothetical protein P4O66_000060 [Electrophorus voltai]|uniref:G-protein coupled receptors family 1 profile domain-containing protein n=1 Tax=Electrophorus voltai TaxID=2609070 RepID=A0AAD8ZXN2_9TELE|nr:hypothetical protein P4O66_000060 [Electrophorus voltai]
MWKVNTKVVLVVKEAFEAVTPNLEGWLQQIFGTSVSVQKSTILGTKKILGIMDSGIDPTTDPWSLDYALNQTTDYEHHIESGICEKSWVRAFRSSYEPPLYWIIFVLGALGNLLVVWIYTTMRNRLKTMTDVYLMNLAIADLLFLGTLPFWTTDATKGWVFGVSICQAIPAVYKINFFAGMLLLTCISVDRYIAIVHVTEAHNFKRRRMFYSKLACMCVWLVSCLLSLPEFLFAQVKTNPRGVSSCSLVYPTEDNNLTKVLVLSLQISVGFCLPLLVMVMCYSMIIRTLIQARNFEKHKALRVIFAVVAAFVLSQLPYNVHLIIEATQAYNATMMDCEVMKMFDVAGQVVKSLAYTHCCLNPILYAFIGVRFRKDLLHLCHCLSAGLGGIHKPQAVPKRPTCVELTRTKVTIKKFIPEGGSRGDASAVFRRVESVCWAARVRGFRRYITTRTRASQQRTLIGPNDSPEMCLGMRGENTDRGHGAEARLADEQGSWEQPHDGWGVWHLLGILEASACDKQRPHLSLLGDPQPGPQASAQVSHCASARCPVSSEHLDCKITENSLTSSSPHS